MKAVRLFILCAMIFTPSFAHASSIIISPSGTEDSKAINAALTGHSVVILSAGSFQVCSPIVIPRNKGLVGYGVGRYYNGFGARPLPWPGTNLHCPNNGTFNNGDAYIVMHDNTFVSGFSITGQQQLAGKQVNCINAISASGITVERMTLDSCYVGVNLVSDGSKPGDTGITNTQEAHITENLFWHTQSHGIVTSTINGGTGTSDFQINNNHFETVCGDSIQLNLVLSAQVNNNYIEDGCGVGIRIVSSQLVLASGNFFSRIFPFLLQDAHNITINNTLGGGNGHNTAPMFAFYGTNDHLVIGPQMAAWGTTATYMVNPGAVVTNSQFFDAFSNAAAKQFVDAATQNMLYPQFVGKWAQP